MEVVDYTDAYSVVPLTFVTLGPGLKSRKYITIRPFTACVWMLMIMAFIVISISIQVLYINYFWFKYNRKDFNRMSTISLALAGALLQQCKFLTRAERGLSY